VRRLATKRRRGQRDSRSHSRTPLASAVLAFLGGTPRAAYAARMKTINGCTIIVPSEDPITHFGPDEMHGAYVVEIGAFPPGEPSPPVHFHPHTDEAFYVADGEATFLLGDREHRATAGGFVFIPRGTVHTVWNSGKGPVRGLIVISPGDAEHEFALVERD
jgi:quercetin dioxygenase-like cupin family protein